MYYFGAGPGACSRTCTNWAHLAGFFPLVYVRVFPDCQRDIQLYFKLGKFSLDAVGNASFHALGEIH